MSSERMARILVVDDHPMVRKVVERGLEAEGFDVVGMPDGHAALRAVQTASVPYDLVITNSCMPGLNGDELIARLRTERPELPILHLDDQSRGALALPDGVPNLPKPFDVDRLIAEVRRLLERGSAQPMH
jgi:DNA-binding response OmpR family regulator